MRTSTLFKSAALALAFAAAPMAAGACSAAGPNTHVGKVLSVDPDAGTFTLLDAETMSPITLAADAALLDKVSTASGNVVVTYEKNGDTLEALELK